MVCIVVNHNLEWSPSLISIFTGEGSLFASAAEGFFAISGILVGYIYGRKITKNRRVVFKKLWKRALLLYILTVSFSLLFYSWASLNTERDYLLELWKGDWLSFIYSVLTLQFTYGWHDFLRQYTWFMLIAPFAILLCVKRKAYIVIILSGLTWLLFRENATIQAFAAWQVIFFISITIGFYLENIEKFVSRLRVEIKSWWIGIGLATYLLSVFLFNIAPILVTYFDHSIPTSLLVLSNMAIDYRDQYLIPLVTPRDNISPVRLLFGIIWFSSLYIMFRNYEKSIEKKTRGILTFFGKNSLFIFCLHGVILFILNTLSNQPVSFNILMNTFVHLLTLLIIFIIVKIWSSRLNTKGRVL